MKKNSNKKTYKIDNRVLLNLEAVLSVSLEDLGADNVLARDKNYLQKKIAAKLDEVLNNSHEFSTVSFKIKIINKTASSLEQIESHEDADLE